LAACGIHGAPHTAMRPCHAARRDAASPGEPPPASRQPRRGEASPTAALLGRISGALGMRLSTLLAAGQEPGARLVRRADQPVWRDPATGYLRRQVSPLSDLPVHLIEVEFPPGAEVAYPAAAFAFIRQAIWVLSGKLEFVEGAQLHRVHPGDCLELGPATDCAFRNAGRAPCRYLVAVVKR
jgi:quercetin dioxygenase-like cupin family protein